MPNATFDRAIEMATGIPAETIRHMPFDQIRTLAENRHGKQVFPPPFISSEQVNRQLDLALKGK